MPSGAAGVCAPCSRLLTQLLSSLPEGLASTSVGSGTVSGDGYTSEMRASSVGVAQTARMSSSGS